MIYSDIYKIACFFVYTCRRCNSIVDVLDIICRLLSSRPTPGITIYYHSDILVCFFCFGRNCFRFLKWNILSGSINVYYSRPKSMIRVCSRSVLSIILGQFRNSLLYLLILVSTFYSKVKCILNNSDWFSPSSIRYMITTENYSIFLLLTTE